MRIGTFHINGVNSRLPNLLRWLEKTLPDVACFQKLEAAQKQFPEKALLDTGY